MSKHTTYQRMAENEVIFRHYNESVVEGIKHVKEVAEDQSWQDLALDDDTTMYFYCECADESCMKRILMSVSKYGAIHKVRSVFIVTPGHEVTVIEDVIQREKSFYVVRKHITPDDSADQLQPTPISNV